MAEVRQRCAASAPNDLLCSENDGPKMARIPIRRLQFRILDQHCALACAWCAPRADSLLCATLFAPDCSADALSLSSGHAGTHSETTVSHSGSELCSRRGMLLSRLGIRVPAKLSKDVLSNIA